MKLPGQLPTQVFVNARGEVAIVQKSMAGDDEVVVTIARENVLSVIKELTRLIRDDSEWPEGAE